MTAREIYEEYGGYLHNNHVERIRPDAKWGEPNYSYWIRELTEEDRQFISDFRKEERLQESWAWWVNSPHRPKERICVTL